MKISIVKNSTNKWYIFADKFASAGFKSFEQAWKYLAKNVKPANSRITLDIS